MEPPPNLYRKQRSTGGQTYDQQMGAPNNYGQAGNDGWSDGGFDQFAAPSQSPGRQPAANYNAPPQHTYHASYGQHTQQQQPFEANAFYNPFPQQMLSDPMLNAAEQYGKQFAEQQKEKMSQYVSVGKLKYYFAVDNAYVGRKLGLLLFPWAHRDWSVKYASEGEPVAPRYDINAPDLYIPLMAILTYVLVAGFALGTQHRFTPEDLGLLASNVSAWLFLENIVLLITKYVMDISQALSVWHCLALSSYKFVGMTCCIACFLMTGKTVYYCALGYLAAAVSFFLIRSVKSFVLTNTGAYEHTSSSGTKRKLYLLLFISLTQPLVMWWLTSQIAAYAAPPDSMQFTGGGSPPLPMGRPPPREGGRGALPGVGGQNEFGPDAMVGV